MKVPSVKNPRPSPGRRRSSAGEAGKRDRAVARAPAAKEKAPARARRSAGRPSKRTGPSPGPTLRFRYSPDLRRKVLAVLAALERARDPTAHSAALAEVVVELTNVGLDDYYMKPLAAAGPSFLVQQSANLGMAGVARAMGSAIRGVIGQMDGPQLLSVCGSIRGFMG